MGLCWIPAPPALNPNMPWGQVAISAVAVVLVLAIAVACFIRGMCWCAHPAPDTNNPTPSTLTPSPLRHGHLLHLRHVLVLDPNTYTRSPKP